MEGEYMNIEFIGAGAGSGKTYEVVQNIRQALTNGQCQPSELIATTFTKKAALELRQRLRKELYAKGLAEIADRMDEALIGTVHSICRNILEKYAFHAGISPDLEVLEESDSSQFLSQVIDECILRDDQSKIRACGLRLDQESSLTHALHWRGQLKQLLAEIRANDIDLNELPKMAKDTVDDYLAVFGQSLDFDLDSELIRNIEHALGNLPQPGDTTGGTEKYIKFLTQQKKKIEENKYTWRDWIKLAKEKPTKKSEVFALDVQNTAARYPTHSKFQEDIREYVYTLFEFSSKVLAFYQERKSQKGVVDFTDLERLTHCMLRDRKGVTQDFASGLKLVVVDEFQDTNPLQMALFLQFAACADRSVWVGDVKQSIYGFRGSTPSIVDQVVSWLKKNGSKTSQLEYSWRSVPDLVSLTNHLFVTPFKHSIGLEKKDVTLTPKRSAIDSTKFLEFLHVESGELLQNGGPAMCRKQHFYKGIAKRIVKLLSEKKSLHVFDDTTCEERALQAGDIAILCRKNDFAQELAQELLHHGIPASLSASGLIQTPEATLVLASMRYLLDPTDTLARAEILQLRGTQNVETVLESRIRYLQAIPGKGVFEDQWGLEGDHQDAFLTKLNSARKEYSHQSPSELLDFVINEFDIWKTVSSWGPDNKRSGQRRSNLEALRNLTVKYENQCAAQKSTATAGDFLAWCIDLAEAKDDSKAANPSADTVQILTYHSAKGLEWPVVICCQLEGKERDACFNVKTISREEGLFDIEHPLANQRIHFWPYPFDPKTKTNECLEQIRESPTALQMQKEAESEALRLLYVGLTRARDRLILVEGSRVDNNWLNSLEASWLDTNQNEITLPDGKILACDCGTVVGDDEKLITATDTNLYWLPENRKKQIHIPAQIIPSAQSPISYATVDNTVSYGTRIGINASVNETALGNAIHSFLAYFILNPKTDNHMETANHLLKAHGLDQAISSGDLVESAQSLLKELEQRFSPKSKYVEVPFHHTLANGQTLHGFMDLLLETEKGWILIDHKTFPGASSEYEAKALSYSGQLACYRSFMEDLGKPVTETWVNFVTGGTMASVALAED
jgi:ATP-dependent helicase/nuclease subunit A